MMPEISVIVPVYNVEQYICRCVDSILSQTYKNFEVILIDDGSLDNCPSICDDYIRRDSRVKVLHIRNGGVSRARNVALNIVSGKYITFCDSDDYWRNDWLESLYLAISSGDFDVVSANYTSVDDFGTILKRTEFEVNDYYLKTSQDIIDFLSLKILCNALGWTVCHRIFKADIIKENDIRFCETCGNFAEDLGFVLEYTLYCKTARSIASEGYCYVQRENSMMHMSADEVKLDSMNEISKQFGKKYFSSMANVFQRKQYPILHFLIMNNQYWKIIGTQRYPRLSIEIGKIQDQKWYIKQTKALFRCYLQLKKFWGKDYTRRILLFSGYCLHGNWKRFQLECAVYYKFAGRE